MTVWNALRQFPDTLTWLAKTAEAALDLKREHTIKTLNTPSSLTVLIHKHDAITQIQYTQKL